MIWAVSDDEHGSRQYVWNQHQQLLFVWLQTQLEMCNDGGVIVMDQPAPMTSEQMAEVLFEVSIAPNHKSKQIVGVARNRQVVSARGGEVRVEGGHGA